MFVGTIFGFVSYKEFVFVNNVTSDTEFPWILTEVITSLLTSFVTLSMITMLGGLV